MERDRTLKALRLAESTLSGVLLSPESQTRRRALFDVALGGVLFMYAGAGIIFVSIIWTLSVASILYGLFGVAHIAGQLPKPSWGVLVGALAIVYFALPSRHAFAGVTDKRVKKLVSDLQPMVRDRDDLKRLQAGVDRTRANSLERINRTTFLLNLGYGAWF